MGRVGLGFKLFRGATTMWGSSWAWAHMEQALPMGRALVGWALTGKTLMGKALTRAGPGPYMGCALMGQALLGEALVWAGPFQYGPGPDGLGPLWLGPPLWAPCAFTGPHGRRCYIASTKAPSQAPRATYEPHAIYWGLR